MTSVSNAVEGACNQVKQRLHQGMTNTVEMEKMTTFGFAIGAVAGLLF